MAQKQQRLLLEERGMHFTTIRSVNQMRGTCPVCSDVNKHDLIEVFPGSQKILFLT